MYDVDDSSAGVMDLDQYVRHYFKGDATELNRLRKEGFQVAASTDYVRSDGIEIATHLVQFTDATGAEDYFDVEKSAWTTDDRVTAAFEVPATPDAVGYELSKVDSLGNRRSVMYEHVGNVVVVVNIYTSRTRSTRPSTSRCCRLSSPRCARVAGSGAGRAAQAGSGAGGSRGRVRASRRGPE